VPSAQYPVESDGVPQARTARQELLARHNHDSRHLKRDDRRLLRRYEWILDEYDEEVIATAHALGLIDREAYGHVHPQGAAHRPA
jgi:hypothetical protein